MSIVVCGGAGKKGQKKPLHQKIMKGEMMATTILPKSIMAKAMGGLAEQYAAGYKQGREDERRRIIKILNKQYELTDDDDAYAYLKNCLKEIDRG